MTNTLPPQPDSPTLDLSIVIPALNEADNLAELIPLIRQTLEPIAVTYEIIVVDERADERTRQVLQENHATLICPNTRGYGKALWTGISSAQGKYIVTMDADISHPPRFLTELWQARQSADIIIASRYVQGGKAEMPVSRYLLSKILNYFFGWGLGLRVKDLSSGYRLYDSKAVHAIHIDAVDFDALQEILVKASFQGFRIQEVPFAYYPRKHGSSHARVIKFGMAYLRLFARLWFLRLVPKAGASAKR